MDRDTIAEKLDEQTQETLSEFADDLSIEVSKLLREKLKVYSYRYQNHTFVFDTDDHLDELVDNAIQGILPKVYKGKIGVDI